MIPKPKPTATKHRTDEDTDTALYALQKELAELLDIPVARLRMNWVLAAAANYCMDHANEVADRMKENA